MSEYLTVNIQMKIPVLRDSAGRRLGLMNLIHPHLTPLQGEFLEGKEYDDEDQKELADKVMGVDVEALRAEWARVQRELEAQREREHRELYGMSRYEFHVLDAGAQKALREKLGLVWLNGCWRKPD